MPAVAVRLVGAAGAVPPPPPLPTTMALTWPLSMTVVKVNTICPLAFALTLKVRCTALLVAPAAAKMSKFDSSLVPFAVTLKVRLPAAVQ